MTILVSERRPRVVGKFSACLQWPAATPRSPRVANCHERQPLCMMGCFVCGNLFELAVPELGKSGGARTMSTEKMRM